MSSGGRGPSRWASGHLVVRRRRGSTHRRAWLWMVLYTPRDVRNRRCRCSRGNVCDGTRTLCLAMPIARRDLQKWTAPSQRRLEDGGGEITGAPRGPRPKRVSVSTHWHDPHRIRETSRRRLRCRAPYRRGRDGPAAKTSRHLLLIGPATPRHRHHGAQDGPRHVWPSLTRCGTMVGVEQAFLAGCSVVGLEDRSHFVLPIHHQPLCQAVE